MQYCNLTSLVSTFNLSLANIVVIHFISLLGYITDLEISLFVVYCHNGTRFFRPFEYKQIITAQWSKLLHDRRSPKARKFLPANKFSILDLPEFGIRSQMR